MTSEKVTCSEESGFEPITFRTTQAQDFQHFLKNQTLKIELS